MTTHSGEATLDTSVTLTGAALMRFSPGGLLTAQVTIDGSLIDSPRLLVAVAISSLKVRVYFDQQMLKNSLLTDIFNYAITPDTAAAALVLITAAKAEKVESPTYVDLTVTEMTQDGDYTLTVATGASAPRSKEGLGITAAGDSIGFDGRGTRPQILYVVSVGENRVDVYFTEPMRDNPEIRDPANYTFDNGLTVLSVLAFVKDKVSLVTTNQVPSLVYTLTIA